MAAGRNQRRAAVHYLEPLSGPPRNSGEGMSARAAAQRRLGARRRAACCHAMRRGG